MASVVVAGDTSGSVTISAPAVAGSVTVTLPDTTGTMALTSQAIRQVQRSVTGAVATGTTVIPYDDTVPQNTEGDQYMSVTITPKSATSLLRIDVKFYGSNSAAGTQSLMVALFQDSTASALATAITTQPTATAVLNVCSFSYFMTSGTTSATTFKVRAGGNAAGTTTFNGQSGGRLFGGSIASSISVTEIGT